jgi:NADPH2:quinone reductase
MASGSHAELVVVPWQVTWQIPDGADLVTAACVPIAFGTAHDCLFEFGRLQGEGEAVLIQAGASGVGVAAIQLAKRAGATVMATASSLDRLKPLQDLGLDHGIDYSQDNWVDEVRKYAPRGVDVVVDSVGTTLQQSLKCLGYRGRAITVGNAGRQLPMPLDVSGLMGQNQSLTGVFLGAEMATSRAHTMIKLLIEQVANGELTVLVDRTFPLAEAAAAHAFIESRQAIGRVVLIP